MNNDTNKRVIRGEIYFIDKGKGMETEGSVQMRGRPGIIVSNDANNIHSDTVEIVYLTTQPKTDLPTHCTIVSTAKTSTALCEQIQTVSKKKIGDYIGLCTENEMENIDRCLAISLGLTQETEPSEYEEDDRDEEVEEIDYERLTMLRDNIKHMEKELLQARIEKDTYRRMYDNLLEKVIG